jgi:hypothetical protein
MRSQGRKNTQGQEALFTHAWVTHGSKKVHHADALPQESMQVRE